MVKNREILLRGRFIRNGLSLFKVLSLHQGIINLLDTETYLQISIIAKSENMTGMSLLIPEFFSQSWVEPEPGDTVTPENLQIDLTTGTEWSGFIPASVKPPEITEKTTAEFLSRIKIGDSLLSVLNNYNENSFQIKAASILNELQIVNGILTGLEKLVGLGQGMTPAGDDFITGVLLGEQCMNRRVTIDKTLIGKNLNKTTYAGKTLLHLALEKSFPAYLLDFLNEISKPETADSFPEAALKASAHGSTSGRDTLSGFLWYQSSTLSRS